MTKKQEEMFFKNTGLVKKAVKQYIKKTQSMDYEDLYQIGCQGLIKAIRDFDETKGFEFSTFGMTYIKNEIVKEMRKYDRLIRIPLPMQDVLYKYKKEKEKNNLTVDEFIEKHGGYRFGLIQAINADRFLMHIEQHPHDEENTDQEDITILDIITSEDAPIEIQICYSEFLEELRSALQNISPKIKQRDIEIFKMYFGLGCEAHTKQAVGKEFGISGERVRQIIDRILENLRDKNQNLEDYLEMFNAYNFSKYEDEFDYDIM